MDPVTKTCKAEGESRAAKISTKKISWWKEN